MRELTKEALSFLNQCSAGLISKEKLEQELSFKASFVEMKHYLDTTLSQNDFHGFEAILWGMPNTLNKAEEAELYREYLARENHYQHDNIVTSFQTYFNDNKENISILMKAITIIPEYLEGDDISYPYIRKIIYAIGAQPEPYNFEALEALTKSEDVQIRDLALHQIEKRKELGRWEARKNKEFSS